ncbi:MAG: hypothetical protein K0R12_801 [Gammaproteobacteria bacterium]|jgi:hypothetical protein|nr:hypothetical protein [Gammaproteobacteria bacterium]
MKDFLLQSTSMAQWHAVLNEAQASRIMNLAPDLENYLVFLLMRFTSEIALAEKRVALDFLESVESTGLKHDEKLQQVGDTCLLLSGLFPGIAERRWVKVSYFVDVGQSAYGVLAQRKQSSERDLFTELCNGFVAMMDVLQATRNVALEQSIAPQKTLTDIELWNDTRSQSAYERLAAGRTMPLAQGCLSDKKH